MIDLLLKTIDPWFRLKLAGALIIAGSVFWPVSAVTWASGEQQFILGLSWAAVILTALDMAYTALVAIERMRKERT